MGTTKDGDSRPRRVVRRCHEACRLEEQLWVLVFEELWPVVSRSACRGGSGSRVEQPRTGRASAHAKGA